MLFHTNTFNQTVQNQQTLEETHILTFPLCLCLLVSLYFLHRDGLNPDVSQTKGKSQTRGRGSEEEERRGGSRLYVSLLFLWRQLKVQPELDTNQDFMDSFRGRAAADEAAARGGE